MPPIPPPLLQGELPQVPQFPAIIESGDGGVPDHGEVVAVLKDVDFGGNWFNMPMVRSEGMIRNLKRSPRNSWELASSKAASGMRLV